MKYFLPLFFILLCLPASIADTLIINQDQSIQRSSGNSSAATGSIVIDGVVFSGQNNSAISGSGVQLTETRIIENFNEINVLLTMDIRVVLGDKPSLAITADDNILPLIKSESKNRVLTISSEGSYTTKHMMSIVVTVPSFRLVSLQGAGSMKIEDYFGKELTLNLQGSGDMLVTGQAQTFKVNITGSGDIDAQGLQTEISDITLRGSGDAYVKVNKKLHVNIEGSGDLIYDGTAIVTTSIRGSGDVIAKQ